MFTCNVILIFKKPQTIKKWYDMGMLRFEWNMKANDLIYSSRSRTQCEVRKTHITESTNTLGAFVFITL